jgi:hypothetical protein
VATRSAAKASKASVARAIAGGMRWLRVMGSLRVVRAAGLLAAARGWLVAILCAPASALDH